MLFRSPAPGNGNAQLCIHYDPDFLPLARVRQLATSAGAAITGQYGHIRWDVDGILHERRARAVGDQLRRLAGVIEEIGRASGRDRVGKYVEVWVCAGTLKKKKKR